MNNFFEIVLKKVKTKVLIRVFLFTMFLFIVLYNIIDDNKTVSCCFK